MDGVDEAYLREAVHVEKEDDDGHVLPLVGLAHIALAVHLAHLPDVVLVPAVQPIRVLQATAKKNDCSWSQH